MTVAFPQLGAYGRLGNQLFQIAATVHHAREHDTEPVFPRWERAYMFPGLPSKWFRIQVPFAGEPYVAPWNFAQIPYWDDMALHGYFQSHRFFDRRGVHRLLRPLSCRSAGGRHTCSVHVRRCDYLTLQDHHPSIPIEWYRRAMEKMAENGAHHFRIMSDDPAWCAEQRLFYGHEISRDTELIDLGRAAECEHHIICNSTFGWWAAILSPCEGHVIMPTPWFGPALADHDETQLQVPAWEVLPWC